MGKASRNRAGRGEDPGFRAGTAAVQEFRIDCGEGPRSLGEEERYCGGWSRGRHFLDTSESVKKSCALFRLGREGGAALQQLLR